MDPQPTTKFLISAATIIALAALAVGTYALFPAVWQTQESSETAGCANQRVFTSLDDALKDKDTACILNLSRQNLTSLPRDIGRLAALRRLDLSQNQLTELPPEIGWLREIRHLDLSHNQLAALSDQIGWLRKMTVLKVGNNILTSVPPAIGHCQELRHLDVSNNQLKQLPPDIRWLTNLSTLNLSGNDFTQFQINALSQTMPVVN